MQQYQQQARARQIQYMQAHQPRVYYHQPQNPYYAQQMAWMNNQAMMNRQRRFTMTAMQ